MKTHTKRKKRSEKVARPLKPAEKAYLFQDKRYFRNKKFDKSHYEILVKGLDETPLLFGQRTRRQLLADYPEYQTEKNMQPRPAAEVKKEIAALEAKNTKQREKLDKQFPGVFN